MGRWLLLLLLLLPLSETRSGGRAPICPSHRAFERQLLAALGSGGRDLATTLRGWRPAVVRGFVTPESAEALKRELLGPAASYSRMTLDPAEAWRHRYNRKVYHDIAMAADAAANPERSGLSAKARKNAANASCVGILDLAAGEVGPNDAGQPPRRKHWAPLTNRAIAPGQDRVMLDKPPGYLVVQLQRGSYYSKDLNALDNEDFEKYQLFGPAPNLPCFGKLLQALASDAVAEKLSDLHGFRRVRLRPFGIRIYQHKKWYHYTGSHTDQMRLKLVDKEGRNHYLQSLVSVNLNIGGDEEPGFGNGGLVWCTPSPRWVPAPTGSATMFRIGNHSWHAVLPGLRRPSGARLTMQILYAAELPVAGTPSAPGYSWDDRPLSMYGPPVAAATSEDETLDPDSEDCHDVGALALTKLIGPWTDSQEHANCEERLLNGGDAGRADWRNCASRSQWMPLCCATCQRILRARDALVIGLTDRRHALAASLAKSGLVSDPLKGSGRRLPLLALGTGGMSGKVAREVIAFALRAGYRHLDSGTMYPSYPDELLQGVADSGVQREKLFITNKVPPDAMGFEATWALVQRFAEEMPGGYADLCMVHWPNTAEQAPASVKDPELWSVLERVGTWKALEAAHDMGICKALGVSNFMLKHLQELQRYARVPPAVNQIEYSPTAPLTDVLDFCRSNGIVVEAFAWNRLEVLVQQELLDLAQSLAPHSTNEVHRDFAQQVLMRWFVQQGMVPLFRTERQENILTTAEGLLKVPQLSEAQIQSLYKPRSDYPWKYYGGAVPWTTAVLPTAE